MKIKLSLLLLISALIPDIKYIEAAERNSAVVDRLASMQRHCRIEKILNFNPLQEEKFRRTSEKTGIMTARTPKGAYELTVRQRSESPTSEENSAFTEALHPLLRMICANGSPKEKIWVLNQTKEPYSYNEHVIDPETYQGFDGNDDYIIIIDPNGFVERKLTPEEKNFLKAHISFVNQEFSS